MPPTLHAVARHVTVGHAVLSADLLGERTGGPWERRNGVEAFLRFAGP